MTAASVMVCLSMADAVGTRPTYYPAGIKPSDLVPTNVTSCLQEMKDNSDLNNQMFVTILLSIGILAYEIVRHFASRRMTVQAHRGYATGKFKEDGNGVYSATSLEAEDAFAVLHVVTIALLWHAYSVIRDMKPQSLCRHYDIEDLLFYGALAQTAATLVQLIPLACWLIGLGKVDEAHQKGQVPVKWSSVADKESFSLGYLLKVISGLLLFLQSMVVIEANMDPKTTCPRSISYNVQFNYGYITLGFSVLTILTTLLLAPAAQDTRRRTLRTGLRGALALMLALGVAWALKNKSEECVDMNSLAHNADQHVPFILAIWVVGVIYTEWVASSETKAQKFKRLEERQAELDAAKAKVNAMPGEDAGEDAGSTVTPVAGGAGSGDMARVRLTTDAGDRSNANQLQFV